MNWRKGIREIEIDGERVNIKKGRLGWRVVYPVKNMDGSTNWKNLLIGGNWWNLIITVIVLFILLLAIDEYVSWVKIATQCLTKLPDHIPLYP